MPSCKGFVYTDSHRNWTKEICLAFHQMPLLGRAKHWQRFGWLSHWCYLRAWCYLRSGWRDVDPGWRSRSVTKLNLIWISITFWHSYYRFLVFPLVVPSEIPFKKGCISACRFFANERGGHPLLLTTFDYMVTPLFCCGKPIPTDRTSVNLLRGLFWRCLCIYHI